MAGEKTTSVPNFFILLDIDPNKPWDQNNFEKILETKRSEWTRKSNGVGNTMLEARRNLALVSKIREVMADPTQRQALAEAAKKELAEGNSAKIEQFERQLAIATSKGFLNEAEFNKFLADYKSVLSEKEIRSRIKVPIKAPETSNAKDQQLDSTLLKAINERLQKLGKADLYEFLGRPKGTSCQELSKAAEEIYAAMQRRQPKTLEVTMTSELAGHAKTVFKSEDMRQRYNESLRLSKLQALLEEFEKIVNAAGGTQKGLYAKQVALFIERAVNEAGLSQLEAGERLRAFANQRHWFLEVPTIDISEETQRCGYCGTVNKKANQFCSGCTRELRITCPNCGQPARSEDIGCVKCGFDIGNRYWVDDLLKECRQLLAKGDIATAEARIKSAEEAWKPAKPDTRARQIAEYRAEIQRLLQAQQQSVEQLKDYLSKRLYFTAREYLSKQAAGSIPDRNSYLQTVTTEIARAQELLTRAKERAITPNQRIDLCVQALRICADYKEARDILSTTPPAAPRNLRARVGGSTISLQWEPSPTPYVTYKIVRKIHAQPVSVKDGLLLDTVTGRVYDDTKPEIGVPTFYAVFASLEDIPSTEAAMLAQPVMKISEVSNVAVRVDNQQVNLSWTPPPHVHNIVVVRKERTPPASINDGIPVQLLDFQHLVDRSVQNERLYFYTIYAQFKDHEGHIVTSAGVAKSATPESPPAIIPEVDISSQKVAQGYEVALRWIPPAKGRAVILKSKVEPKLKAGDAIPKAQLEQLGELREDRPDSLVDPWRQPGITYYTPVVLFQDMAYVGNPRRFAVVDDVSDLRYQNLGHAIRLNWTWPANCQEVLVAYDYRAWPQLPGTGVNTYKVTRAEYEHRGYFDIRGTPNSDHYIVVAAIIRQGNDQIIGSGTRIQARLASKIVIEYEIKLPRGFFGPKKLLLHITSRTAGSLPTLLLVSKQGRLPLRKEEGEPFIRFEGPVLIESELDLELPIKSLPPRTFGKLYLEDDRMYDVVTIHHPPEDKLRLV